MTYRKLVDSLAFATIILFACGPQLLGQTAGLTGVVSDSTGAVIPGVELTATHVEKNVSFRTNSNELGRYILRSLPVGTYELAAAADGFKSFRQSGIELTVDLRGLLNVVLQVGDVTETISVEGQVIRVDTETATMQQLVDSKRVVDLPLNGRDVYQLASLVPGTGKSGFNINGSRGHDRDAGANVRVDGGMNIEQSFLRLLPAPSPDAVREFAIQTSVPSAAHAYAGGVIEIATKSGTNELHGTAYNFFRNDALDARNFFSANKTKRRRNQYGFSAGGPARLPGYDGRNRTFWFVNFEQQKEPLGSVTTIFVPTQEQLRGDFSGINRTIRDPDTREPFPGNIVPQSRLDPLALNLTNEFVPQAQSSDGRFVYQRPADNNPTQLLARVDHTTGRNQFTWRTFVTRIKRPEANGNLPYFSDHQAFDESDLHTASYTRVINPQSLNVFRFSYNNRDFGRNPEPAKHDIFTMDKLRSLGWSDQYFNESGHAPRIGVSGFFTLNNTASQFRFISPTWSWEDDLSLHRGKHNLTMGMRAMRTYYRVRDNTVRLAGRWDFSGQNTGAGLTDFMLGRPTFFGQ